MAEFGPDGPWGDQNVVDETRLLERRRELVGPRLEAMQLLEHSELVYVRQISHVNGDRDWSATRFGLATLADGKD